MTVIEGGSPVMNGKIRAFVEQIRKRPKFVAAAASDPKWIDELDKVERLLNKLDRQDDDDPRIIEAIDKIQGVVGRRDLSIKQRLLEVGKLLVQFRDAQGVRH